MRGCGMDLGKQEMIRKLVHETFRPWYGTKNEVAQIVRKVEALKNAN